MNKYKDNLQDSGWVNIKITCKIGGGSATSLLQREI